MAPRKSKATEADQTPATDQEPVAPTPPEGGEGQTGTAAADADQPAVPAAPAERKTEGAAQFIMLVRVVGPAKGRWRAGRFFSRDAVLIPADELGEDEKAALAGDPSLTLSPHEVPISEWIERGQGVLGEPAAQD